MAQNISGFGLRVQIVAKSTFPAGVTISQWADDTDWLDLPSMQIADKAMGGNGDLLTWSKANPIILNLAIVPTSDDDQALSILFENNRAALGKSSVRDEITLVAMYPDGSKATFTKGAITDGMPFNSASSASRLKSKTFSFAFENVIAN